MQLQACSVTSAHCCWFQRTGGGSNTWAIQSSRIKLSLMKISPAVVAAVLLSLRAVGQNPIYDHSFISCPSDRPCIVTDVFNVHDRIKNCCILQVANGDGSGNDQARGAEVVFNGRKQILDKHAQSLVFLRKRNTLNVTLEGGPHARLRIRIAPFPLLDACDLISQSREHSGMLVAVKGVLYSGFEEFVLLGSQCSGFPHSVGIWVLYPDELDDNPKDVNAKRLQLRVKQDGQAKAFEKYLKQRCAERRVAVTLSGYFEDSSEIVTDLPDGGHVLAGFGHMDMYSSRLVIASIEDPEALPCSQMR